MRAVTGNSPCKSLIFHQKVRQSPDKPGSVSPPESGEPCHLSNLQVTLQLKRSTLHRSLREASGRQPCHDDGIRELAASRRHSPNGHPPAGGLLHHLLTLTGTDCPGAAPGSIRHRRLFSSAYTCCHQQLPVSEVERLMLPGLSSRTAKRCQRQAGALSYYAAKLIKTFIKRRFSHVFLFLRRQEVQKSGS